MRNSWSKIAAFSLVLGLALVVNAAESQAGKKINGKNIKKNSIRAKQIGPGSITGVEIEDGSITGADLAPGTLTPGADSIGNTELQDNAVTSDKIEDGSVTSSDVADELIPSGVAYESVAANITVGTSATVVSSVVLLAPVDGHITVTASGTLFCTTASSSATSVTSFVVTESDASVTTTPGRTNYVPPNQFVRFSQQWAQPVVAGATTVDFRGYCQSPATEGRIFPEILSVTFHPNRFE